MFTTDLKRKAKEHYHDNRTFYKEVSIHYLTLSFLAILILYVLEYLMVLDMLTDVSSEYQLKIYDLFQSNRFTIFLCILIVGIDTIFKIKIYDKSIGKMKSIIFEKENMYKNIVFVTSQILLQLPFYLISQFWFCFDSSFQPFDLHLGEIKLTLLKSVTQIVPILLSWISYFMICAYTVHFKQPLKFIFAHSIKQSIRNTFKCIRFELSFILWFTISVIFAAIAIFSFKILFQIPDTRLFQYTIINKLLGFLGYPLIFGLGIYFFPYYNIAKMKLYQSIDSKNINN